MTVAPPRILLIDDDLGYAALVRALLPGQLPGGAAEVVHETTLQAGSARLEQEAFDCVLVDNDLPDGRGVERISHLATRAASASVVLLSGTVDHELAKQAIRLGAQDALRKGAEVEGVLGPAVHDAMTRGRAEDAVRAATARMAGVLDHAPDAIFVKDDEGRYVLVNAAWSRTTGLLPDDAYGRTDAELFPPEVAERFRASDARALAAGRAVSVEERFDGRAFVAKKFPLRNGAGQVVGVAGISSDVSPIVEAQEALAEERRHHDAVLGNLPDMAVTLWDRDLRCVVMEGRFARQRGHDADACFGLPLLDVFPALGPLFLPHLLRGLDGDEHSFEAVTPDGVPIELTVVPQRGAGGRVDGVLLLTRDVSAARAAEREARAAREIFASAFEASPIGMAITTLDGRYETANAALCRMVGRRSLAGARWQDLTHPVDVDGDLELEAAVLRGERTGYQHEKRYRHADGHDVRAALTATLLRDGEGRPWRWCSQVVDVTDRRRFEERLERMAHHDELTGLLNRRGFERALGEHLEAGAGGSLVVLDLDGFKVVNDTLGHSSGDQLIASAAAALAGRLRATDVLARLGGDEFAVLLPAGGPARGRDVAEALCEAVREDASVLGGGRRRGVTVSAGVVAVPVRGARADRLLAEADLAMYDAKGAGGDRVVVAGEGREDGAPQMRDRVAWLDRLRVAIEDERFVLHAQAVLDLATGDVDHHELLLRLPDGAGGLVPPDQFLPVAEQAGLIVDLDRWVLRHALHTLAAERAAGRPRRFSVNLSGRSIGRPEVLAELEAGLGPGGASPGDLIVEMTETAAIGDVARARRFAERLRELGVALALDDFGVGFGSFYELKHLPCDEVKVDGEFVRDCATSETDRLVIRSLVDLARALGKRTVAEFVHDEATARTVRALGVELGQGFHLGRPVPLADVLAG